MFSQETGKIDVEVLWRGEWVSFNDRPQFTIGTDGFGTTAHSRSRKTVSSDFFSGEYTVSERDNNQARQLSIQMRALDRYELDRLRRTVFGAFSQHSFKIRTTIYEEQVVETSSGSADITFDGSHVMLHNTMMIANVTFNVLPIAEYREEQEWLSPWTV